MKKKISILLTLVLAIGLLAGCDAPSQSTDKKQASAQETMLQQANDQVGMPNIVNFQEKKLEKQIMELCDQANLVCYAYTFSEYTGKYNYMGKCIGFGLPYGTEYTSPERPAKGSETYEQGNITLPQADPNGLFKAENVQATWICMLDDQGNKYILYNEPNISISSEKLPKGILNTIPENY